MGKEIRRLGSIKTLMGMKHRSLPKAERANDAELYLLKNNLAVSTKELSSITERKKVVEKRVEDIKERIAKLEMEEGITRTKGFADASSKKPVPRGAIKVMRIDY
jgi:hypothetical protein